MENLQFSTTPHQRSQWPLYSNGKHQGAIQIINDAFTSLFGKIIGTEEVSQVVTVTFTHPLFIHCQVWKESSRIGCGQAISKGPKGGTFTVCNYDPPGNYENEELDNVSPATGGQYYDFAQESRYKSKKLKIQYTQDGHSSSTHTFSNGQYSSKQNQYKHSYSNSHSNNFGSQFQTFNKWSNFRPHTSINNNLYSQSKPFNGGNKFSNFQSSRSVNSYTAPSSYSSYRPSFKMSLGKQWLW